jgi:hypothetical protein
MVAQAEIARINALGASETTDGEIDDLVDRANANLQAAEAVLILSTPTCVYQLIQKFDVVESMVRCVEEESEHMDVRLTDLVAALRADIVRFVSADLP